MGLVAHWALTGSLLDISGNGLNLTSTGTVTLPVTTGGKIGKTYQWSNAQTGSATTAVSRASMDSSLRLNRNSATLSFWMNPSVLSNMNMFSTYTQAGTINMVSWRQTYFYCEGIGNTGTDRFDSGTIPVTMAINTWYHFTVTFDNEYTTWYMNGVQFSQRAAMTTDFQFTHLGTGGYDNHYNGKLNDVRVYDYALSPNEIKEIAKAKVLHYTFNDFKEPTHNYLGDGLNGRTAFVAADWNGAPVTQVGTSEFGSPIFEYDTSDNIYTYTNDEVLDDDLSTLSQQTVTFSLYIRRLTAGATGQIRIYDNITSYTSSAVTVTTFFQKFSMTKTIGLNPTRMFVMIDDTGGGIYEFHSTQLEMKGYSTPFTFLSRTATVRDGSGFGNDATMNADYSPEWQETSRLGTGSYHFYDQRILTNNGLALTDTITLASWVKLDTIRETGFIQSDYYLSADPTGHLRTYWYDTSSAGYHVSPNILPTDEWIHVAAVWNGTQAILYENGLAVRTVNSTTPGRGTGIYVAMGSESNNWPPTTSRRLHGNMADVRIYGTPLSATEIFELYETSAQLDNRGNLHLNEVNETKTILLVEEQQKDVIDNTFRSMGNLAIVDPDISSFVESDFTLGNYRVEGQVYLSSLTYYPTTFEFQKQNNLYGVRGTFAPFSGTWVLGWNYVQFKPSTYDNLALIPWDDMDRLEVYRAGPATGTTGSHYIIFKDLELVKNLDNELIQNNLENAGVWNTREVSEVGITEGLTGFWKLNGDARDYSGNGNDGTVSGALVSSGLKDLSYLFNGSTDLITTPNSSDAQLNGHWTLSFWQQIVTQAATYSGPFRKGNGGVSGSGWIVFHTAFPTGNVYFKRDNVSVSLSGAANANWNHIAFTYDGVNVRAYLNGVLGTTYAISYATNTDTSTLLFGRADNYANNKIADVRIYNRRLEVEDVNVLYKYGLPATGMQLESSGRLYTNNEIIEEL